MRVRSQLTRPAEIGEGFRHQAAEAAGMTVDGIADEAAAIVGKTHRVLLAWR
jgi:hypothetical protein